MIPVALLIIPLSFLLAEVCVSSPEPPALEPPEWHWRTVDGRKCYFRADALLPRNELFWEYDAAEFDRMEGATVTNRKFYNAEDLRAKVVSPDQSRPRKKPPRLRRRRKRDDDDDD